MSNVMMSRVLDFITQSKPFQHSKHPLQKTTPPTNTPSKHTSKPRSNPRSYSSTSAPPSPGSTVTKTTLPPPSPTSPATPPSALPSAPSPAPGPACANSTCALFPENPLTRRATLANALLDSLALPTTDGSTQLSQLGGLVPDFLFSCSQTSLLQRGRRFGRSNFSIPAQVCRSLSLPRSFALCLSGSRSQPGPVFLGSGGPSFFNSKIDLSKSLIYTPLILNPVGSTVITYYLQPSDEYFIGLTSIRVNAKAVPINASLLTVDENGFGGTKISTVHPYTVLETSIYKAFADLFVKEALGLNLTATATAVNPFGVCYAGKDIMSTRVGPDRRSRDAK
ncbi:hypothetical protein CMV_008500 [Castanea mollissima]|uniref:Xylanase inhibitor C-terminal domain-containing protein n=1 Tax=Castanea mollissima TaxID=60419 RepID=A0A8J4RG30_9ROSI|nr:hypothetical protein CMV_008500 [Castanea mollissima]